MSAWLRSPRDALRNRAGRRGRPELVLDEADDGSLPLDLSDDAETIVVTMTRLNRESARVVDEVVDDRLAIVSRHGRFVAAIVPLDRGSAEDRLFGRVSVALAAKSSHRGSAPSDESMNLEKFAAEHSLHPDS